MSLNWIKFKRSLRQGEKRGIPRATRFIYLELSLEAGDLAGEIVLPRDGDLVTAVHDLIGGSKREIAAAMPRLMEKRPSDDEDEDDRAMVEVVEDRARRILVITSWERHNHVDDSSDRVRRHRAKRKKRKSKCGEDGVTRYCNDSVTRETHPRACARSPLLFFGSLLSEEGVQGEGAGGLCVGACDDAREFSAADAEPPAVDPKLEPTLAALRRGRDIYPARDVPESELVRAAERIHDVVSTNSAAQRDGMTPEIAAQEAVTSTREWADKSTASPRGLLAHVETVVVRFILTDCRRGTLRKTTTTAIGKEENDALRERQRRLDREEQEKIAEASKRPPTSPRPSKEAFAAVLANLGKPGQPGKAGTA